MPDAKGRVVDLYQGTAGFGPGELGVIDPAVVASLPADCLLAQLGITPTHIGRGACRAEMTVQRHHLNQRGIAQAGALVAFADATAGWASYAALETGSFTTLDLTCNLLRAAVEGDRLVAEARPVHLGRRTLVFDVEVRRVHAAMGQVEPARPVAHFGCTQLVLDVTAKPLTPEPS